MSVNRRLFWFLRTKEKHRDGITQRCLPTFFTLDISMLFTFLCLASLIDAFDPKFLIFNVNLWIKKCEVSKKSRFQVLEFFRDQITPQLALNKKRTHS